MEKREKGLGWEKGLRVEGRIIDKEGKRAKVAKGVRFKGGQKGRVKDGKKGKGKCYGWEKGKNQG